MRDKVTRQIKSYYFSRTRYLIVADDFDFSFLYFYFFFIQLKESYLAVVEFSSDYVVVRLIVLINIVRLFQEVYVDSTMKRSPSPNTTFCIRTPTKLYCLSAPSAVAMSIWIHVVCTGKEGVLANMDM